MSSTAPQTGQEQQQQQQQVWKKRAETAAAVAINLTEVYVLFQTWRKSKKAAAAVGNRSSNLAPDFWETKIFRKEEEEEVEENKDKETGATDTSSKEQQQERRRSSRQSQRCNATVNDHDAGKDSTSGGETKKEKGNIELKGLASAFLALVSKGAGSATSQSAAALLELLTSTRCGETSRSEGGGDYDQYDKEEIRLFDILLMMIQHQSHLQQTASKMNDLTNNLSSLQQNKFQPTAFHYYLEYEDERKNPSWKRRQHRFECPPIVLDQMEYLHHMAVLAELAYADSVTEIQEGLSHHEILPCELVHAQIKSEPGQPAHYIALVRNQPADTLTPLQVVMGVRGTKSIADALTDLMCDDVPYRTLKGKAHKYILESGKYISTTYKPLLRDLLEKSGKSRMQLLLVGHSLGAGAASIAGMEFQDDPSIDVNVIGFGCPAILSQDLAEQTASYITTVVNDNDLVPRMSGITIANLLNHVMEFDWKPYAKRDVDYALAQLQRKQPILFHNDVVQRIQTKMGIILTENPLFQRFTTTTAKQNTTDNTTSPKNGSRSVLPVELFPPGKCIHLYRDGTGISANYVPCTFFNEIDVHRRMVDDHLFHTGYYQSLLEIMRQHKGDHHFRFSSSQSSAAASR